MLRYLRSCKHASPHKYVLVTDRDEQPGLFSPSDSAAGGAAQPPLSVRMRPSKLEEIVGQTHIVGDGTLLRRLIETDRFGSLIFHGPPGSGKTSLAEVIAASTGSRFKRINAVLSNVAELRDCLRMARYESERPTLLFIDELHRFNKSQQDLLLPDVEAGHIRLIGATTHNPGFYVNAPLLSRSHLFRFEPIAEEAVVDLLRNALTDDMRGLGSHRCTVEEPVYRALAGFAGGDLRRALNALETLVLGQPNGSHVGMEAVETFAAERRIRYDRNEDEHYDHASALIKSIRGSDPDAALYWAFKMLEGGEDPRFLCRRLVILASEDIGLANSHALTVAVAAFQACELVGLPECEYNLAHAILYLATSPKSNSATRALGAVKQALGKERPQGVPPWLRDKHSSAGQGSDTNYLYSHDFPEGISGQEYLLEPRQFYEPRESGAEAATAARLERIRQIKARIQAE